MSELMSELNIPIERVVRHFDASRKNCPASMSANNWMEWYKFKERLKGDSLTMSQYEELKNRIDEMSANLTDIVNNMGWKLERLTNPMIYNYIDDNMPKWAREAVKWAVDNKILNGDENGLNLDDKDLRYITMLWRMRK
ncbi:MAG: hypothetical protein EGR89_12365 [[Eubacterium] rectale]|nr:hypothetical protein [Agathobacter rectalis]